MKEIEVWREIKGYEGLYEVSNLGRVRSLRHQHGYRRKVPKILKPGKKKSGYLYVNLCKNGKVTSKYVHRLVAEAFIENPLNLPQINHIDENKTNNVVFLDENGNFVPEKSNLEWISQKDNVRYGTGIERRAKAQSRRVLQFNLDGNLIREWISLMEVSRQTGWSQGAISECCRGEYKTSHGYVWRYAE